MGDGLALFTVGTDDDIGILLVSEELRFSQIRGVNDGNIQ